MQDTYNKPNDFVQGIERKFADHKDWDRILNTRPEQSCYLYTLYVERISTIEDAKMTLSMFYELEDVLDEGLTPLMQTIRNLEIFPRSDFEEISQSAVDAINRYIKAYICITYQIGPIICCDCPGFKAWKYDTDRQLRQEHPVYKYASTDCFPLVYDPFDWETLFPD